MFPNAIFRHVNNIRYLVGDHSTTILTGVGVAGTVGTAILTGKASFKAVEIINEDVAKKTQEENARREATNLSYISLDEVRLTISTFEKAKMVWPLYIPPIVVGGVTVVSIVTAHRISSKKVAALIVASGVSERALQEYKEKMYEKLTPAKRHSVRDGVAQDRVNGNPVIPGEVIITGKGEVLFYDEHSGRYFHSTMEDVKRAENKINHELLDGLGCSLTEFYDELGIKPSNYSDSVGWNGGERIEIEFSTTLSADNRPCIAIDFRRPPVSSYNRHTYR